MHPAIRAALASLLVLGVAACGSAGRREGEASTTAAGVYGVSFKVTVSRPQNGTVTSSDGSIRCGTGGAACAATYAWSAKAVLTATPDAGYALSQWLGDCQGTGTCTLDTSRSGADKYVVALFGAGSALPHPNYTSPAVHGPAFLDRLGNVPGALDCANAACHRATYDGVGLTPSCNACHAAAGWAQWQTNCTFCHGTRVKAGYAFAGAPEKAAPPDAVGQRLTGAAAPARTGAHQPHLSGVSSGVRYSGPFSCATCHVVPAGLDHVGGATSRATVKLSGAGQASLPADLGAYDPASGKCTTYCHGDGKAAGLSPAFAAAGIACDGCHGMPPTVDHPYTGTDLARCALCHQETMKADGTIVASGKHLDGVVDGTGACDACHGFPPATGAHVAHFGLAGTDKSGYGDTRRLEDLFPAAAPTEAPAVYAFGCGNCHPSDFGLHANQVVEITLHDAAAPAGSLKRLSSPTASYDRATRTCSGTYCHSSGQATPSYRTPPAWDSGAHLGCNGCHDDPPRYASGGAGSATANTHLVLADDGYELGHFLGLPGPWHYSKHGGQYGPGDDSAPITCQTCHFGTTDPASTGPGGFYWLDTTGDYHLPGGWTGRYTDPWYIHYQCTSCHVAGGPAPVKAGKVLPLRHVNGKRDVEFDPRSALPPSAFLPAAPNTPAKPYWATWWSADEEPPGSVWSGSTLSFGLGAAAYDPATKTCSNVGCHLSETQVRWGTKPVGFATCDNCHGYGGF